MKTSELYEIVRLSNAQGGRSQWRRGVLKYALELAEHLKENYETIEKNNLQKACLNGACSWTEYSEGGYSLIYNEDIADRLATKSEIKARTNKNGTLSNWANSREQWLDVQARALRQAYLELKDIIRIFDYV